MGHTRKTDGGRKQTDYYDKRRENGTMELKEHCRERFEPAVWAIRQLQRKMETSEDPILVAIDGRCGSGKTTLGEYLIQVFDCNVFRMDDFFLRMEQRTPERMAETGGNVDYERFKETVLAPVLRKETVFYQPFSCQTWGLLHAHEIPYKKLNIIEGSYSMHPYFGNPYQLRIFLNISPEDQMENIKRRNGLEKAEDFRSKWIPKEEAYFEKFRVMDGALEIMWDMKL